MEDARIILMQKEIKHLQEVNRALREENRALQEEYQRLKKSLKFNFDYIEMAAKLKAAEYIIRSEDKFIEKESLSAILEIPLSKKDDDCDDDDWEV